MNAAIVLSLSMTQVLNVGPGVPAISTVATGTVSDAASVGERRVALRVDHSALLEKQRASTAEDTAFFVREGSTKALTGHSAVVVDDADAAPTIAVALSWVDYRESIYRVEISTNRPAEEPRLLESFECECYDEELTAAVAERMPAALARLDEDPATVAEPVVERPVVEHDATAADSADGEPSEDPGVAPVRRIGGVGIAGIVVAVGGLGVAGVGISRLAIGEVDSLDPGNEEIGHVRDVRPPGRAWLGAGVGVAVVGVTMLALDLTVLRKRRARTMALAPGLGPHGASVMWSGRF